MNTQKQSQTKTKDQDQKAKTEKVKAFIKSKGSKLISVHFVKKDKTIRQMTTNANTVKGLVGEENRSSSANQAVKTRKANNPNLINVCDIQLAKKDGADKGWRSINCDTVISVKCGDDFIKFDDEV